MALQLLINISIAILWMFLNDSWNSITFITGFLVGLGIVFVLRRFFNRSFYLKTAYSALKLVFLFIQEIFSSSILVIKQVTKPKIDITPGVFTIKTDLKGEWEITLLSLLLSLVPGAVVLEISPENDIFYIHAMDIPDSEISVINAKEKFERAIMEVTQ